MEAEKEVQEKRVKNGQRHKIKLWLAVVLSVIVFVLVVQNTQAVTVSVLFWNLQVSLIILIPFVFLVGLVVGYVLRRKR
jgi:uncharacterized integral membrane protein